MRRVRTEFIDDLFRFGISLEIIEYLLRKLYDIHLFQRKHHFIIFDLPEIENLIHDIQQMACVTLDRPDITLNFGVFFPFDDTVERIEDKCQRRTDFVGDICKKLQFMSRYILYLCMLIHQFPGSDFDFRIFCGQHFVATPETYV